MTAYVESTVPNYLPDTFKGFFKLTNATFEVLCQQLSDCPDFKLRTHSGGRQQLSIEKKILIAIRYLSSQETISELADRFGVTVDSVMTARRQTCAGLRSLKNNILKWPSDDEKHQLASEFDSQGTYSFPGIIGAIDGTHISIEAPSDNPNAYFNRKRFHSVILQGVASYDLKFTNVYVGWPGRVHDAKVLKHSSLWESGYAKCNFGRYHLIGDAAYPVRKWLMTPFRDTGNLTAQQNLFNRSLSSKRQCIERAFGLLKGRFRRLKHINIKSLEETNELVLATCVLHNICIDEHDLVDIGVEEVDDHISPVFMEENEREGFVKRSAICNQL